MTRHILGIETSCDETSAAIVSSAGEILANIVASQTAEHKAHGGVVPEIAARAHLAIIDEVIEKAFTEAGLDRKDIDAIAATGGPGLIGGVIVGATLGKALSLGLGVPFYAINHLEGHALTARLTDSPLKFPYLLLLISGGHTQLLGVEAVGKYHRYGGTLDDAVGEAFDKSAKLMGLGMAGGAAIEAIAKKGDENAFELPHPLRDREGCDFSFSGLKTAVLTAYEKHIAPMKPEAKDQAIASLAASLQKTIAEILAKQSAKAMGYFKQNYPEAKTPSFVVAGGVAANERIRSELKSVSEAHGFSFKAPPPSLCTDNGAMIAWAAHERIKAKLPPDDFGFEPRPRWQLYNDKNQEAIRE